MITKMSRMSTLEREASLFPTWGTREPSDYQTNLGKQPTGNAITSCLDYFVCYIGLDVIVSFRHSMFFSITSLFGRHIRQMQLWVPPPTGGAQRCRTTSRRKAESILRRICSVSYY